MKHILAQLYYQASDYIFKCVNCNEIVFDHNAFIAKMRNLNIPIPDKTSELMCGVNNITDDNCQLTCAEALIKELLE